jgi:hypothetical protein
VAPKLLRVLLETEAWRDFRTALGEHVHHDRFQAFVEATPDEALGAEMELIERLVGTHDPDLLVLLHEAQKVGRGSAGRGRPSVGRDESSPPTHGNADSGYLADRLARDAPEQYERVRAGDLSINAAAVAAGIRPRRVSVCTDDAASAARSLHRNMPPVEFTTLIDEAIKLRGGS